MSRGGSTIAPSACGALAAEPRRATRALQRVSIALALLGVVGALAADAARAATLSIAPPAAPVAESSGFPITFSGNASDFQDGEAYLFAELAPAGGQACGPTPGTNDGTSVSGADRRAVAATFTVTGSAVLPFATTYLVCAWLTETAIPCCGERIDPPVSATVVVRAPNLAITASAVSRVAVGTPFEVTVNYSAEVPRRLTVLVTRASSCSISSDALRGISTSQAAVVDGEEVSGVATIRGAVRFDQPGTYLICGFFEKGDGGAAQYAYRGPSVVVAPRTPPVRACGRAGGPRRITQVTARVVRCATAKSIARIWGRRARPPTRIGVFRCTASAGRARCSASGQRLVTFRYRARR